MRTKWPQLFHVLADVGLALHHGTIYQWWHALERGACPKCAALRALLQYHSTPNSSYEHRVAVFFAQLNPHRLVYSLECLHSAGLLPRTTATMIEEKIFD